MGVPRYHRPALLKDIPRDRHAVIEASAGTGKTYAIEHLVLDLLLNTTSSIEEILVVTFTEKATVELRSRIRNLVESILLGAIPEPSEGAPECVTLEEAGRRKLEAALFSFDRAPILTIHGFCRRILNEMAFDTGAAFDFEIVDSHRAFHRAFRNELREGIAMDPDGKELLEEWLTDGDTARHPNLIDSLEELLREAHFNRYLQFCGHSHSRDAVAQLGKTYDEALIRRLLAGKSTRGIADRLAAAKEITAILREGTEPSRSLFEALSSLRLASLHRPAGSDPDKLHLLAVMEAALMASSLDSRVVDRFLPSIANRLRKEKDRSNEIDYADMLEKVWEALEGSHGAELLASLRTRFRYGLVDEFQDTDDLQWKIFRRIFLESGATNILFAVGDPKQAIYGFRGADVNTYLQARREIDDAGGVRVSLLENHRSSGQLINALNRIFDQSAAPPLFSGEINYHSPVRCGRQDLAALTAGELPVIPVTLLDHSPPKPPSGVAKARRNLGRWMAAELRRILFNNDSGIVVRSATGARRVEAKDVFVLTRSGFEAVEVAGYLREQGVPFAFYKKDGLLQTPEAYDIYDVLRAIDDPDSQSKRLKALTTPFFAVPYAALFDRDDIGGDNWISQRLYGLKALADQTRFGELFDRLIHQSGLATRELFLSNNERELTNYLHIFEMLLEEARKDAIALRQLIARLESFIHKTALPAGTDSNVQRIESERSAVQIMTVHMSKGLQADVVFLFGGLVPPNIIPRVSVYHDEAGQRRLVVGKDAREFIKDALQREYRAENERLAYVALTRARVKIYLPVYRPETTKRPVNGYYEPLNSRLQSLLGEIDSDQTSTTELFERVAISELRYEADELSARLEKQIAGWCPAKEILECFDLDRPERSFNSLRAESQALQVASYTTLGRGKAQASLTDDIDAQEFKYDRDVSVDNGDLRGGRRVGIFLHEVIEKLDLASFSPDIDLPAWRENAAVRAVFQEAMRRHQVIDRRWWDRGTEMVFNALTSRLEAQSGRTIGPLYKCRSLREMEFVYPIPEHAHRLLRSEGDGSWKVERGYLKGIVDFVFKEGTVHYFADWKSDSLASYAPEFVESYVSEHYELQARIYSIGVVRLLRIANRDEYDRLFGGLFYLFLRGMRGNASDREGVYFRRPDWSEISDYERGLIDTVPRSR